jgi:hypothetical protein
MNHRNAALTVLALVAILVGCATLGTPSASQSASPSPSATPVASATPTDTPSPSPTPSPTDQPRTTAELKVALIEEFGQLWYCDPDYYPVARDDEKRLAIERFDEIRADQDAFAAILAHFGWDGGPFSDDQKLRIYRLWKQLNAMFLERTDGGAFAFDLSFLKQADEESGWHIRGTIARDGEISVDMREPGSPPNCPICLARGVMIATPDGPRRVQTMRVGDAIWTVDAAGHRIRGQVLTVGSMRAPRAHQVVQLRLDDGRVLRASPGHPLADGRLLGTLRIGDRVDGARVIGVRRLPYGNGATYDLLAGGPTGSYWANGIILDSTLAAR